MLRVRALVRRRRSVACGFGYAAALADASFAAEARQPPM
jgi:hypothetical protein